MPTPDIIHHARTQAGLTHPLVAVAYARWQHMTTTEVLGEMAILFHLAVKIEEVHALDRKARDALS